MCGLQCCRTHDATSPGNTASTGSIAPTSCRDVQDAGKAWRLLPAALGLKTEGLLRAMFAPAALTAALFLGPLALLAVDTLEQRQRRGQRRDEVHIMSRYIIHHVQLYEVQVEVACRTRTPAQAETTGVQPVGQLPGCRAQPAFMSGCCP